MKKNLKMGYHGVISQLCSVDVQESIYSALVDLLKVINNHPKAFGEISKTLPPTQCHYHGINFKHRDTPPNIRPYRFAYT